MAAAATQPPPIDEASANAPLAVISAPSNPFNLSGPVGGRHSEFGVAVFTGQPTESTPTELQRSNPRAGILADVDAAPFTASQASTISRADGKFLSTVDYTGDRSAIRIESWTPDGGPFTLFAPLASPVTEIKQTTIAGHPAVTLLPTDAVVGGTAPRQAYVETGAPGTRSPAKGSPVTRSCSTFVQRVLVGVAQ